MTENEVSHRHVDPCWEPGCGSLSIPPSRGCCRHCSDVSLTAAQAETRQREVNAWVANCECDACLERPYPVACMECGGEVATERPGYVHAWDCSSRGSGEMFRIDQSKPPLIFAFPSMLFLPTRLKRKG